MSKTAKWIVGVVAALVVFFGMFMFLVISWIFSDENDATVSTMGEKVAVVDLHETIMTSEDIVRQFKKYRDNRAIRAIVFRVDSPGGGVAASQEIYEEVRKTTASGKPVVVSMGAVAASGGYYVSCPATRIVANPGTLTGSIGVIMQFMHVSELMKKVGIEETTIKTGALKDAGSPFRKLTAQDKRYFDDLVMDVYDQFVDAVAEARGMDRNLVKKYADGRVFTGRQAYELGFVDTLGTMEDALLIAAKLGGISGKPTVVRESRRVPFFERMMGEAATELRELRSELVAQPILQYKFSSPY
jgi:protease IV